ncbi:hypothetical protein KMT30_34615, partial [Streptomyces sp. IBSBF 2953]|nr:hypothetical protein [Streptomyces hayashii]
MKKSDDRPALSRRQMLGRAAAVGGAATIALSTGAAYAPGASAATEDDCDAGTGITAAYALPGGEQGFVRGKE